MQSRRSRQKGQAFVEAGLILFIFLTFLIGTLDFGQYLYFHQSLSERARAALRYGITNVADRTGIKNMAVYNDPAGTANGATALVPSLTTAMIAVCLPGDNAGCSDPAGTSESRVTVTISGYPMVTFNLLFPREFTNKPIAVSAPSEAVSTIN
jgi:Flp pilus assembly protein TadG